MRSKWKLPSLNFKYLQKIKRFKQMKLYSNTENIFLTKQRGLLITPDFVHSQFKVYNGAKYISLKIKEHHVGYKLGNFIVTKHRCIFKKKKNGSKS